MFKKHIEFFLGTGVFRFPEDGAALGDLDLVGETNDDVDDTGDNADGEDESDKDKDEEKGDKEVDSDKEGEDDDSKVSEDDDEEKDESSEEELNEEDEETEAEDRVTHVTDIKKSYPDFFKKFPDVKAALYRDQQYGELFGSPNDAKDVVSKAGVFDQIQTDLVVNGDPVKLLTAVKKDSPESYGKIALSLLPFIQENDKELYLEVAALPIKQLLRAAFREGKGKETNLGKAALYVHEYFFGDLNIDAKVKAEDKPTEGKSNKEKEYEAKLQKIEEKEYTNFFDGVNQSYTSRLSKEFRSTIEKDERLTEWAKTKLVEDGMREIRKALDGDPRYTNQMKSLWGQAKQAGYTNDFKSRILNTALARAKSLVPKLRSRLISEALGKKVSTKSKDSGNRNEKDEKVVDMKQRQNNNNRNNNSGAKKPQTDIDILRGA